MTSENSANEARAAQARPAGDGHRKLRLQWWPSLAGLGFAAFVAADLFGGAESGADIGPIVAASGLVYLGAAALHRPIAAWPLFFLTVLVITASKRGWVDVESTWILLAIAGAFLGYGLLRSLRRPRRGLSAQAIAMAGFGAAAAAALIVNETAGALLVAAGLFAHAAWDVYHHWTEKVVTRSLAEFCFVLDTVLGALIVFATLRGLT